MVRRLIVSIGIILIMFGVTTINSHAQTRTSEAVETLRYYFDLLLSGNLESAKGLWTQPIVERSSRFGIEYEGIPFKMDCNSPIVRNLTLMRDYLYQPAKSVEQISGSNYYRLEFSAVVKGNKVTYPYYAYYDGTYFWLTYPQEYYCQDWPIIETKYFRIHYDPDISKDFLHPMVLEAADTFIEDIADSLNISNSDLKNIADKKIEYFYCKSDSVVEVITGKKVKGVFDLPTNDIISAFFPHYHEIVHLLVNIKLHPLPLYTEPLMSEGIAVHLGGRWGKATPTLYYLGAFLIDEKIVEIDSILTMRRFQKQATADMAYPASGLFTAYLLDRLGYDRYFELYRTLSNPVYDSVLFMKAPRVKTILYETVGEKSWGDLMKSFNNFIKPYASVDAAFAPGGISNGREIINDDNLKIKQNKHWIAVTITGNGTDFPTGNIMFDKEEKLQNIRSLLFEEQYEGKQQFPGFRYGLRFDGNEAGLYDYATNQLIAKYIWGITPSDSYKDDKTKTISFKFKKELSNGVVPWKGEYTLLPN